MDALYQEFVHKLNSKVSINATSEHKKTRTLFTIGFAGHRSDVVRGDRSTGH